ncbi:transglycosylase domain-containing protein [Arsenicicoccus dermatophilus]|uniref:transglycosylase domain-containing protein n=1 Tax=Arsenicicoccus dermatophilus TaxID=1076331 RepID=UPI001F4C6AB6|nr:penicillin-binding protein [Arsenicicoccus dermatophilus]
MTPATGADGAYTYGARRTTGQPAQRRRPLWARLLGWFLLVVVLVGLVGVVAFGYLYSVTEIPEANPASKAQISTVYFADGKTEMGRLSGSTNRENVPLKRIPLHVQRAFLAAEDRSFYTNKGVSPSGIGRAVKVALQGGQTQGGSTITQQYVKNTFLTRDQTMQRKLKELILSLKLDQQRSKDQILQDYLNTIDFGRGASGIQAASRAYFSKDVSQLDPAEGALLASVIKGPALYDPSRSAKNLGRSKERVAWILDGMTQEGWLTSAQRAAARYPTVVKRKPIEITGGTNGYLIAMVTKELTGLANLDDDQVKTGGLRIVTTIDKKQQDAMIAAIHEYGATEDIPGAQTGMTAIKPGTGEIQALYGGEDFRKRPFNNAVDAHLSAGSTFKAYTTVAALESGFSTRSRVSGSSPYEYGPAKEDKVENEYNQQYGFIDIRGALADSVNTAFIRINEKIGPAATKKAALQAGIPATPAVGLQDNLTNTLGTATPSVLDNTNGFATIAAQGRRATPHLIRTVKSTDGEVDYTASTESKQTIDKDIAIDTTEALTHPITEGTAVKAQRLRRPAAGKTGTAEDHKEVWFIGYTPQLAAGCAIYKPQADGAGNEPLGRNVGGFKYCVPIWTAFMREALDGQDKESFPKRVGVNDDGRKNFSKGQVSDPGDGTHPGTDGTTGDTNPDGSPNGSTGDGGWPDGSSRPTDRPSQSIPSDGPTPWPTHTRHRRRPTATATPQDPGPLPLPVPGPGPDQPEPAPPQPGPPEPAPPAPDPVKPVATTARG